jgi:hydrogenase maturation factor
MLGEMDRGKLVTSAGARPGDAVILAGAIAVEGTALLAREVGEELRDKGLDEESLAQAKQLLFDPGISVVPAARAAMRAGGLTAMHDPTEGGLATGLLELALASGVGLEIEAEAIPVLALTRRVCAALSLDPLGLIASGSLLITARPETSQAVMEALRAAGREAAAIGRVVAEDAALTLVTKGRRIPLPRFERDELARFFEHKGR